MQILRKLKRVINWFIYQLFSLTSGIWVNIVKLSAETGIGTEPCLKKGVLPLRVHYYSPIPNIEDLVNRRICEKKSNLHGVEFHEDVYVQNLIKISEKYGKECKWPAVLEKSQDTTMFFTENNSFSFSCAAVLHSMIRYHKPVNFIEIGSGRSSQIISTAISLNKSEGSECNYTIIDPYPGEIVKNISSNVDEVIDQRVEIQDPLVFEKLKVNDILFIDSGHTVKTGGDVNYLFFEVLPLLNKGVFVHFHDIYLPFEYPEIHFTNESFRMFWTESYLLQAFLTFNPEFVTILPAYYLMREKRTEIQNAFKYFDPNIHKLVSSSYWIQRKNY